MEIVWWMEPIWLHHYILPEYKAIIAGCAEVAKKGQGCCVRPIVPYSNHYLRLPYKKEASGLNMVVQSVPPGQVMSSAGYGSHDR